MMKMAKKGADRIKSISSFRAKVLQECQLQDQTRFRRLVINFLTSIDSGTTFPPI